MLHQCVSVVEMCRQLSIKRTKAYALIRAHEVEKLKIGSRTLITKRSIDAFIERRLVEETADVA